MQHLLERVPGRLERVPGQPRMELELHPERWQLRLLVLPRLLLALLYVLQALEAELSVSDSDPGSASLTY